jgi:hypothetical protein
VPPRGRDAIVANRKATLRGDGHAVYGHALLTRLKLAAALALLDQHQAVSATDWELAGTLMAGPTPPARASCVTWPV